MTEHQKRRAYAMAESWAIDPERLAALFAENRTDEQDSEFWKAIAKCFYAMKSRNFTRETAKLQLLIEIDNAMSVVVETVFLPIAERLIAQEENLPPDGVIEDWKRRAA